MQLLSYSILFSVVGFALSIRHDPQFQIPNSLSDSAAHPMSTILASPASPRRFGAVTFSDDNCFQEWTKTVAVVEGIKLLVLGLILKKQKPMEAESIAAREESHKAVYHAIFSRLGKLALSSSVKSGLSVVPRQILSKAILLSGFGSIARLKLGSGFFVHSDYIRCVTGCSHRTRDTIYRSGQLYHCSCEHFVCSFSGIKALSMPLRCGS